MPPSKRHTAPDHQAGDDDLRGPTSAVRPTVLSLAVPSLAITPGALRSLPLDARAAYLLSLLDGHCSVELILDICGSELAREEAFGILTRLLQLRAIVLLDP